MKTAASVAALMVVSVVWVASAAPAVEALAPQTVSGSCTWSVVTAPSGDETFANRLEDVVAVSASDVWAVGWLGGFAAIQHWDGTSWTNATVPAVGGATQSRLLGVDAAGANDVWAVGYAIVDDAYRTLTIHWDGTAWSIVPSPNLAIAGSAVINALNDVTIVSATDAWAVGGDIRNFNANISEAVLMRWNGSKWSLSIPPAASIETVDASRYAVDAVSSSDVWALGDTGELRWDGTRWNYVGVDSQTTVGVTALATNNAWAVGTTPRFIHEFEVFPADPYASQWNGTTWVRTSLPKVAGSKGTGDSFVRAVDAAAINDVWAVGLTGQGTYVVHYDGTAWSLVSSPDAVTTFSNISITNELFGIAALSSTNVWAVGFYRDASLFEFPLILHYTCDEDPDPDPVALASLSLGAKSVVGGSSTTGTVTLSDLAPAGGTTVTLSSSQSIAVVPSSVVVPAGSATATFQVTTTSVRSSRTVTITASYAGASFSEMLRVTASRPPR
ncbi:MAG TPA: hypothetical protein VM848_07580 [Acidimicrobiia bacterium]|nr:hypothetical protein [Acidimicrobiia bacterium]